MYIITWTIGLIIANALLALAWYKSGQNNPKTRSKNMSKREEAIRDVAEAQKCLDRAQAKLERSREAEAVTYSIGDRFRDGDGMKHLLASKDCNLVAFVSLKKGWGIDRDSDVRVSNFWAITEKEIGRALSSLGLTRYFNFQTKEVNHDGC